MIAGIPLFYQVAASLLAVLAVAAAFARTVARSTTNNALESWRETAHAQTERLAVVLDELHELRTKQAADADLIKHLQGQVATLETTAKASETTIAMLQREIKRMEAERVAYQDTIRGLTAERDTLQRRIRKLTERISAIEKQTGVPNHE